MKYLLFLSAIACGKSYTCGETIALVCVKAAECDYPAGAALMPAPVCAAYVKNVLVKKHDYSDFKCSPVYDQVKDVNCQKFDAFVAEQLK